MTLPLSVFLSETALLGSDFAGPSWDNWKTTLRGAFGEPLSDGERVRFRELAGRDPPARRVRELWLAIGRRAGKDSVASAVATYLAVYGDFQKQLRRGERAVVLCLAVDKTQASLVFGYIKANFEEVALLRPLLVSANDGVLELRNNVDIIVTTNNFRAVRGRTVACAILDEISYWRDETSANPDVEVYNALMPSMITLRAGGAMLIAISTVYRKQGLFYEKFVAHHGKKDDDVLFIRQPSHVYNPLLTEPAEAAEIARLIAVDPARGAAEWNSEWRTDIASFLARELILSAVDSGVTVRPRDRKHQYFAFADPSGGISDSFTVGIAHIAGDGVLLDLLFEAVAPFSPSEVVDQIVALLRSYGLYRLTGDAFGNEWVTESFRRHGITYEHSKLNRSEIYLNALPLFAAGRARLVDNDKLVRQFLALERRVQAGGRDRVDHPQRDGHHDDLANACAGALTLAAQRPSVRELWARAYGDPRPAATPRPPVPAPLPADELRPAPAHPRVDELRPIMRQGPAPYRYDLHD